jgi:hypothetical protein
MIDVTTRRPLYVSTAGDAGPYILVSVEQLATVKELLDAHGVSYWVDEEALSIDGGPEITEINLGRQCDPKAVQRLLDSLP